MQNKVIISASNVSKTFDKKQILKNLNFNIYQGECLVILGGSGCGKTVLIKMLSGLLNADLDSKIIFNNLNICKLTESKRLHLFNKMSFAFQLNALFDSYTIWQNICFRYLFDSTYTKSQMIEIAKQQLTQVGLDPNIINFKPKDISGGMQKRVAIARALVSNPEVVFFDEPTSGLDPLTSEKIADLIKNCDKNYENKSKITKISIMHDIKSALAIADRILFLKDGVINWIGSPEDIQTKGTVDIIEFVKSAT
jgi:phospholipid/cholesterol/gamma-HCH transport system ATP-binding protein